MIFAEGMADYFYYRQQYRDATHDAPGKHDTTVSACPYRRRNQLWVGFSVRCGYRQWIEEDGWWIWRRGETHIFVQPIPCFGLTFIIEWADRFYRKETT